MKLVPLSELFEVAYGVNLELSRMTPDPNGIAFVGRSERNNGVTGRVARLPDTEPMPAETITVAGSGSVMAAFVQPEPYYSGFHLFTLIPKAPMTLRQKLYYCACIRANRYRYNYGRQANRTLRTLEVPALDALPAWVDVPTSSPLADMKKATEAVRERLEAGTPHQAPQNSTDTVPLSELFDVSYGVNLELNRMTPDPEGIAFVARSRRNNGVTARVARLPNVEPMPAGNITVAGGGNSVMAAFVQEEPYYSGRDLFSLTPKAPMTLRQKLYYCACITANRYRFSYGRQANRTLRSLPLPAPDKLPAWLDAAGRHPLQQMTASLDKLEHTVGPETAADT